MILNNEGRAKQVLILFWIIFGITILEVIVFVFAYNFYSNWINGNQPLDSASSLVLLEIGGVTVLNVILLVLTAIFFILWFRRAYANLGRIGAITNFEEGWAAGAWFVPFLNLVRPYEIMKEIWNGTQLQSGRQTIESDSLVGWWWGLFIFHRIIGNIAGRFNPKDDELTPENLLTLSLALGIASLITLPSIWVTIQMIRKTAQFEEELAIHVQTQQFREENN